MKVNFKLHILVGPNKLRCNLSPNFPSGGNDRDEEMLNVETVATEATKSLSPLPKKNLTSTDC